MIYNDICIIFDLSQNLLTATVYLGCVANLDLSILGYVNVKVFRMVYRSAVTKDRSASVAVSGGKCMSHDHQ